MLVNSYGVLIVTGCSFGICGCNVAFGLGDEFVVVVELGLKGFFEWVENVVKLTGG